VTAARDDAAVELDCLLGRSDSLRAEVFFRAVLPSGVEPAAAMLTGTLTGPECRHAITLPVTAKLATVPGSPAGLAPEAADSVVARAILTEPSFWTPELPNLYRLEARLDAAGSERAVWRRRVGLRRLGVRGRSLWLDGRRYVPRGLAAPAERVDLTAFRAASLAAVVPDPSDDFLTRADAEGLAVIGLLAADTGRPLDAEAAVAAVVRWAWHPAVIGAVVPRGVAAEQASEIASATRGRRGTLLVVWEADGMLPPPAVPAGIDLLVVALPPDGLPHEAWRTEPPVPLIARRTGPPAAGSEPTRRGCDALQTALAAWGDGRPGPRWDWAGYLAG
jgi:hypothetical protein